MAILSIAKCLQFWAARKPAEVAITDEAGSISWDELDRASNRLARAYAALGVQENDFVMVSLPNGIEIFKTSFAIWKLGAVPQPVSTRMPAAERNAIIDLVRPRMIVGLAQDDRGWPSIAADFVPHPKLPDGPLPDRIPASWKAMGSGGSTGRPKIIVTKEQGCFDPLAPFGGMDSDSVNLVPGPLYHNAPFMIGSRSLFSGVRLVIMSRFDAEKTLALISQHRVTWISMVPTMMHRIWSLPEEIRSRYDLSSLKTVVHAAAPCPIWLKERWIEWLGAERILEAYAGTEACGTTMITGEEWLAHRGSVGRAMPDSEFCILDAEYKPVPRGEIGEIYMRPKSGAGSTYYYLGAEPRRTADGWETIGDIGSIDADGYLYIADRRTDMIVSGGANIFPAEVEAAIDAFPGIRSSAVIGLPDEEMGMVTHAIVDSPEAIDSHALLEHLGQRLTRYKIPRSFEFVHEPLRDDAGKIRRSALREQRIRQRSAS